jgi:endonuclease III
MTTKEEFEAYEKVRKSGKTNMFDVNYVCRLSGLSREKVFEIMKTYEKLMEQYPGVRK